MESSRKNKRTYCTPKPRSDGTTTTNNEKDEHTERLNTDQNSSDAPAEKNFKRIPHVHNPKQVNYKIQKYAKILAEIPERISREKHRDHLIFAAANAKIFRTKAAYFPGKNLSDIRQVLVADKIGLVEKVKLKNDSASFKEKPGIPEKERKFGKHLICPKKKLKRMRIRQKPLNTIQEVNENDKSKESLKKEFVQDDQTQNCNCSSINMSYSEVSENDNRSVTTDNLQKKKSSSFKSDIGYQQKQCVSYSFQNDASSIHVQSKKQNLAKIRLPEDIEKSVTKHVLQIRDMFEKMSENKLVPHKENIDETTKNLRTIEFEHNVTCEECRSILKDLMHTENMPKKEKQLVTSEIPRCPARRTVDSLADVLDKPKNKSDSDYTKTTITISTIPSRRTRKGGRRKLRNDMQYKNFFLLALAISIVLYCFYCRLDEKKR